LSDILDQNEESIQIKPFSIASVIHPMSEIEPCHSCENRNPGSWLVFWIPASAGMTILNASIVESLNLEKNNLQKSPESNHFYSGFWLLISEF
jgi:hypothetical protein